MYNKCICQVTLYRWTSMLYVAKKVRLVCPISMLWASKIFMISSKHYSGITKYHHLIEMEIMVNGALL